MPFHCDVCGCTLSGDYDSCPVCAQVDQEMKRLEKEAGVEPEIQRDDTEQPQEPVHPGEQIAEQPALGVLERQLENRARRIRQEQTERKRGSGALMIALILLIVAALGICTALYIVKPIMDNKAAERASMEYVAKLAGSWVSEYFTFADAPDICYAERLVIRADGTFTMEYLRPSSYDLNEIGSWEVTSSRSGTVQIVPSEQKLLLLYSEGDESYYYERSIISMEENTFCLREYYDAEHTAYYDVHFERIP